MKVHVDHDRCEGHGLCAAQAPQLFSLDDDDLVVDHSGGGEVAPDLVAAARIAIASCPVAALREVTTSGGTA